MGLLHAARRCGVLLACLKKAQAYYTDLFTKVYNSKKWQAYKSKKSLMGDFMAGDELKAYWTRQVDNHRAILKASGAIK